MNNEKIFFLIKKQLKNDIQHLGMYHGSNIEDCHSDDQREMERIENQSGRYFYAKGFLTYIENLQKEQHNEI